MEYPDSPEFLRYHELVAIRELEEDQDTDISIDYDICSIGDIQAEDHVSNILLELETTNNENINEMHHQFAEGFIQGIPNNGVNFHGFSIHDVDDANDQNCEACLEVARKQDEVYQRYLMIVNELSPDDEQYYEKKEELLYYLVCSLRAIQTSGTFLHLDEEDLNLIMEQEEY